MVLYGAKVGVPCGSKPSCLDKFGCPKDRCPDFTIRRHDTKPPFRVLIEDCDGPIDFSADNLVLEVNMWAKGKLKKAIASEDTYFGLADDIGFYQIMVGDIIMVDQFRSFERMLVKAFDEKNKLVQVERGYAGTTAIDWQKGSAIKIFRIFNGTASIETSYQDITQVDGTVLKDQLASTYFVYDWNANDTCLPGCYWMEFKLLSMADISTTPISTISTISVIPTSSPPACPVFDVDSCDFIKKDEFTADGATTEFTLSARPIKNSESVFVDGILQNDDVDYYLEGDKLIFNNLLDAGDIIIVKFISEITLHNVCTPASIIPSFAISKVPEDYGCFLGENVEWVRRFPMTDGFLIQITDSPTAELT